jgi:hypothetical protein
MGFSQTTANSSHFGGLLAFTFIITWSHFLLLISCYIFAYIIFDKARLEAMMLSEPSKDCIMEGGTCVWHAEHPMLQIFSVKLAKTSVINGSVELYGYIAARDVLDPLLNYIVNIGRDDPIVMEEVHFQTISSYFKLLVSSSKTRLITCTEQM